MASEHGAGWPSPAKAAEKLRLAEALRANLRRRKAARKRPDDANAVDIVASDRRPTSTREGNSWIAFASSVGRP